MVVFVHYFSLLLTFHVLTIECYIVLESSPLIQRCCFIQINKYRLTFGFQRWVGEEVNM